MDCSSIWRSVDSTSSGRQRPTGHAGDAVLPLVPEVYHRSPFDERTTRSQHAGLHARHLQGGPPRDAEPGELGTWEEALAEPEQLELGVTEGKARSVVALGPSEFPQPIPKETTAAAPPSPGPGPSTVVVEIDESDEDWGEWRPTGSIDPTTSEGSSYLHDATAGGTGQPDGSVHGAPPGSPAQACEEHSPGDTSMAGITFQPGLSWSVSAAASEHTRPHRRRAASPRTFEGELPADAGEGPRSAWHPRKPPTTSPVR